MMNEEKNSDLMKNDIERGHFVRAVISAEGMGLPEEEIMPIRLKAIEQMAAINRNALGTKLLALRYGFSREEINKILKEFIDKNKKTGNKKYLVPCYDNRTGKYLSLEEWVVYYLKVWDNLAV